MRYARTLTALVTLGVFAALAMVTWSDAGPAEATGVIANVDAEHGHTCARTSKGSVKCWGFNGYGGLGDGTKVDSSTPVSVCASGAGPTCTVLTGVAAISLGGSHTCALMTATGGVKCWGYNRDGQLGSGTTTGPETCTAYGVNDACSTIPVDVTGLTSGVAAISAGVQHTCALMTAGSVKCWGRNFHGYLGDGTTTDRSSPVDVCASGAVPVCTGGSVLTGVASISAGQDHTCALMMAGGVKCWGYGRNGRLRGRHNHEPHYPGGCLRQRRWCRLYCTDRGRDHFSRNLAHLRADDRDGRREVLGLQLLRCAG